MELLRELSLSEAMRSRARFWRRKRAADVREAQMPLIDRAYRWLVARGRG
jgi:hypothetical protein